MGTVVGISGRDDLNSASPDRTLIPKEVKFPRPYTTRQTVRRGPADPSKSTNRTSQDDTMAVSIIPLLVRGIGAVVLMRTWVKTTFESAGWYPTRLDG